jgi:steroid 5-alpha reductase family enzyme
VNFQPYFHACTFALFAFAAGGIVSSRADVVDLMWGCGVVLFCVHFSRGWFKNPRTLIFDALVIIYALRIIIRLVLSRLWGYLMSLSIFSQFHFR